MQHSLHLLKYKYEVQDGEGQPRLNILMVSLCFSDPILGTDPPLLVMLYKSTGNGKGLLLYNSSSQTSSDPQWKPDRIHVKNPLSYTNCFSNGVLGPTRWVMNPF